MSWVFYANVAIWAGIGGYVAFLGWQQMNLAARMQQLEKLYHD